MYTFENVSAGVDHKVTMQAIDLVGNIREAKRHKCKTVTVEKAITPIMQANQTIDGKLKGTYENAKIPQGFKGNKYRRSKLGEKKGQVG